MCRGAVGSVRASRIPNRATCAKRGPDLLTADDPFVPVPFGPGGERREVRSRPGLAEQLAPDLLAGEERQQVALLLLGAARMEDGGTRPADADGVLGTPDSRPAELVVDDQLERRVGPETVGLGPVRHDQPALGEVAARRLGVTLEPTAHFQPTRIVVAGKREVHGPQRRLHRPVGPLPARPCGVRGRGRRRAGG